MTPMPDTACQNSSYIASSATENAQLMGKRNASRTPLRRPSQALTTMSPTGNPVSRIDRCGAASFILEREQLKNRIAEAQKTHAAHKARLSEHRHLGRLVPMPQRGIVLQARIGLFSFIEKQKMLQFQTHKKTPNTSEINVSGENIRQMKQKKTEETSGEGRGGLDGSKCLESGTNSRRSEDV